MLSQINLEVNTAENTLEFVVGDLTYLLAHFGSFDVESAGSSHIWLPVQC